MSDMPRAETPQDGPFPFAPTATLDVYIMGCLCEDGICRPVIQRVHGRVYPEGETVYSWYLPSDPLRGGTSTLVDPDVAKTECALWDAWADASE